MHAEKNYLAIKYNPVGFMAIMFGSAVFMIPQVIVAVLHDFFNSNEYISWLYLNLNMSRLFGMCVYVVLMFAFSVLLALLFINPKDLSDNLLQTGDCIEGIPAGKATRRYLRKWVLIFSFISGGIMCGCLSLCLYLQYQGIVDATVAMLPSTFMILSGFICTLYLEIRAYCDFDSYKPFI